VWLGDLALEVRFLQSAKPATLCSIPSGFCGGSRHKRVEPVPVWEVIPCLSFSQMILRNNHFLPSRYSSRNVWFHRKKLLLVSILMLLRILPLASHYQSKYYTSLQANYCTYPPSPHSANPHSSAAHHSPSPHTSSQYHPPATSKPAHHSSSAQNTPSSPTPK